MNDGGAAFPSERTIHAVDNRPGMTLRDWFAGQALLGLLSNPNVGEAQQAALAAYIMADKMMAERGKEHK